MTVIPECRKCKRIETVKLRYNIIASGTKYFFWYCIECKCSAVYCAPGIKHEVIKDWFDRGLLNHTFWRIGLLRDDSQEFVCVVCGDKGAEWHHWAPQCFRELFGSNYDRWPGAYLCKKHHDLWHEIVTPYLPGRGKTQSAREVIQQYFHRMLVGDDHEIQDRNQQNGTNRQNTTWRSAVDEF